MGKEGRKAKGGAAWRNVYEDLETDASSGGGHEDLTGETQDRTSHFASATTSSPKSRDPTIPKRGEKDFPTEPGCVTDPGRMVVREAFGADES